MAVVKYGTEVAEICFLGWGDKVVESSAKDHADQNLEAGSLRYTLPFRLTGLRPSPLTKAGSPSCGMSKQSQC